MCNRVYAPAYQRTGGAALRMRSARRAEALGSALPVAKRRPQPPIAGCRGLGLGGGQMAAASTSLLGRSRRAGPAGGKWVAAPPGGDSRTKAAPAGHHAGSRCAWPWGASVGERPAGSSCTRSGAGRRPRRRGTAFRFLAGAHCQWAAPLIHLRAPFSRRPQGRRTRPTRRRAAAGTELAARERFGGLPGAPPADGPYIRVRVRLQAAYFAHCAQTAPAARPRQSELVV
jgi:hypothetical protein